jgi:hypothetical protein
MNINVTWQHATTDMLSESKHQSRWNEKSVIQAVPIDRHTSDRVLAKIGVLGYQSSRKY